MTENLNSHSLIGEVLPPPLSWIGGSFYALYMLCEEKKILSGFQCFCELLGGKWQVIVLPPILGFLDPDHM